MSRIELPYVGEKPSGFSTAKIYENGDYKIFANDNIVTIYGRHTEVSFYSAPETREILKLYREYKNSPDRDSAELDISKGQKLYKRAKELLAIETAKHFSNDENLDTFYVDAVKEGIELGVRKNQAQIRESLGLGRY